MIYMSWVRNNWLALTTLLLLALFYITLPAFTQLGKNIFYLLSIFSIGYLIFKHKELSKAGKDELLVFMLVLVFLVWTIFTYYLNDKPERGDLFLWNRQVFIVMLLPLYFILKKVQISEKLLLGIVIVSTVVMFGGALYEIYVKAGVSFSQLGGYRVRGGMHPIQYGSIALIFFIVLLSALLNIKMNALMKATVIGAMLLLLAVIVVTQARGVWLALGLVGFLTILLMINKIKPVYLVTGLAGIVISIAVALAYPPLMKRVDVTLENIKRYAASTDSKDHARHTSLGTRLEMWKAGYYLAMENPVIGVGLGGYKGAAREVARKYDLNRSAYSYYHPHNQFVSEASSKGVVGLGVYLTMLIVLFRFFYKRYREEGSRVKTFYMFTGMMVVIAYSGFSLTDAVIEGKVMVLMFSATMAMLMSQSFSAEKTEAG